MTVSAYIIQRLSEIGIEHLFAVPGDYTASFLSAVDASSSITRVPTIAELGAGYAADGYARFKGAGAFCVQYGVGTFSALNCVAGAYVERLPIALISGSPANSIRLQVETHGILPHHSTGDLAVNQKVFANVTAASIIISDPCTAPAQIDGAITAMMTQRRPIYIEVFQDLWASECAEPQGTLIPKPLQSDTEALEAAVEATWSRICNSQRPVLWFGIEPQRFGLQTLIQGIVDASGFPFTTTKLGKTLLDESQPAFIGTYAGPASLPLTEGIMQKTDLPIAIGTIITDGYLEIVNAKYGETIEVNTEEIRVGYARFPRVAMSDFLRLLLGKFREDPNFPIQLPPPDKVLLERDDFSGVRLSYTIFKKELIAFLKHRAENAVLILGESSSLYVFANAMGMSADTFVGQAVWGSLGHETGCALGVALASRKRPYIVAGDGGFAMVCQELCSLVRVNIPAVVFVMSNGAYAIEQAFVDINAFQQGGAFAPFDIVPVWDYLALAQAFGALGFQVGTVEELRDVLQEIDELKAPALIQVSIPQNDLAPQLERLAKETFAGRIVGLSQPDPLLRKMTLAR